MPPIQRLLRLVCSILLTVLGSIPLSAPAASPEMDKDVEWDKLSNRDISADWGERTLKELNHASWKHAETGHFIIHYTKDATRIARRAEEIYQTVFEFLKNPEDRMGEKKSHIYAVHDWEDFDTFRRTIAMLPWIGGVCRGNEFWFPSRDQNGDFDTKGRILNHEMTHLVFNRILPGQIPFWLNEGTAEFFGVRENMGTSQFRKTMGRRGAMPLNELFKFDYHKTDNPEAIDAFYGQSAVFVDFLTDEYPPEKLVELINTMVKNPDSEQALLTVYGFKDMEELSEKFAKHRKKFD